MSKEYSCNQGMHGKLQAERGERPRAETNVPSRLQQGFLQQNQVTTRGSLGVDLETTISVTLTNTEVYKIPSNAVGPLVHCDSKIGGLLLGRSSAGIKGLIVIPGVIDADYMGQICIMAYTICPPLFVPKGSRIAQILPFESPLRQTNSRGRNRGNQGFGSTGPAVCFTTKMDHRPTMNVTLSQGDTTINLTAMLDTGADITIVNQTKWPSQWAAKTPKALIAGVGGHSVPYLSNSPVKIVFPEGQVANVRVHVLTLPGGLDALTGWDVLSQIGAVLTTEHF